MSSVDHSRPECTICRSETEDTDQLVPGGTRPKVRCYAKGHITNGVPPTSANGRLWKPLFDTQQ